MNASERPVFHFHADANPIGGQITEPIQELLPPQGSASLGQAGGHASGRIGPHSVEGVLSFDCAHSEVYGFKTSKDGPWATQVSSVIEGLNILDIVRADAIVAKIKVKHPHDGGPPSVSFGGTHFYNLTVAGRKINPELDLERFSRDEKRVTDHKGSWVEDDIHFNRAVEQNKKLIDAKGAPDWLKRRYKWMSELRKETHRGHVLCSLVDRITEAPKDSTFGHILHVPEVGYLFLGEITVSQEAFRVTMLRAELGCLAGGDVAAATGGAGGWRKRQRHAWLQLILLSCFASLSCRSPEDFGSQKALREEKNSFQQGDLKAAYQKASLGFQRTTDADPLHAAFTVELARVEWYEGQVTQAIELLAKPLPANVSTDVAVQHRALWAGFLANSGRIKEARAELTDTAGLEVDAPNPFLEAARGEVERLAGRYAQAEEKYGAALRGAEVLGDPYLQARMLLSIGLVETKAEHFDRALDRLQQGLSIAQRFDYRLVLEKLRGNTGYAQIGLADFAGAEQNFRLAQAEALQAGSETDVVIWREDEGVVKEHTGDIEQARKLYEASLDQARRLHDEALIASLDVELGNLLLNENNPRFATCLEEAARIYAAGGNEQELLRVRLIQNRHEAQTGNSAAALAELLQVEKLAVNRPVIRWQAEQELALLAVRSTNDADAHRWFERAIRTFQQQQCSVRDIASKLPFEENGTEVYRSYVEHLIGEGRTDEALMMYDEGRATSLRDCEAVTENTAGKRRPMSAPDLKALAKRLQGTILIYYLLPQTSYLWAISPERKGFYRLPGEDEITGLVNHHQALMKSINGDPIQTGDDAGRKLYDTLVGPAQSQIKPEEAVYVLADRGLSKLNFDTLLTPGDHPHFWIEDVTIVNASSLHLLAQGQVQAPRLQNRQRSAQTLVIGNPAYPSDVPALPYAPEEVKKVAAHFAPNQTTLITGASATSSAFLQQDLTQYSNIHVVAHAEANEIRPLDSYLLLSGKDKLHAYEIAGHSLKADLVTLSVCDGSGKNSVAGEGLVGLAWAFERAGARNVIGTLWEVDDETASRLMDHLYANLAHSMSPERALREAKLTALHSDDATRKPYYWAQYQLYSNSSELRN